ncbi:MAG: hypothetical protein AAGI71_05770 [Bacteroidota bacterium]
MQTPKPPQVPSVLSKRPYVAPTVEEAGQVTDLTSDQSFAFNVPSS